MRLKRAGFEVINIKGSHHYLKKLGSKRLVTVPVHLGEIIPLKTLQSVLEQAEIDVEKLIYFV